MASDDGRMGARPEMTLTVPGALQAAAPLYRAVVRDEANRGAVARVVETLALALQADRATLALVPDDDATAAAGALPRTVAQYSRRDPGATSHSRSVALRVPLDLERHGGPPGELRFDRSGDQWTANERSLAAEGARLVVDHLRLLADRMAVEEENERLVFAEALATALSGTQTLDEALRMVLERLCDFAGWPYAEAWVPDAAGGVLRRRRSCERASGLGTLVADGAARTIARGAGLAGQAWESGEPVYEPCFAPDRGYREAAAANACGLSASLAVPVAGATDVLAVVVFHLREGSPRSAALLHFVSAVIAQLSAPLARVSVDLAVQHIARGPCALFDSLADFVVTTDMDGRIAYCNDAFLSAMQRVRVPVIGGDVFTLFSTDPVRDRARVRRAIEGRRVAPVELDLRGGDGVRRRVRWQGVVMASDDGVPQGIAAIGTDVTEAYRSRRTNDILAESIDGTREAIVLVDADGRVGWLNRRFAALLDMPRESVVGASLPSLAAERVGQYALDALVDYCKAGVRVRADHEHRLPGGERVMLRTAFDPVRDDEGRVLHYLATMRDVTSERARQRELLRLSSAVHVSTEGIAVTDGLGNFVVVNEAFAQLHGYALTSDLHGTPWQGRIAPTVPATYTLEILRALARHGTWTGDLAVRRRDGTELVARYALSMLDDDGVVIAAHDQTARIAAERDLVRARDAAEAATRAQANFVSVVSHELRTPLNAIIGFSNIVVKRSGARLDDKDRDYLARVREGGMTLLTLIDEILTHAKVEAGSLSIERSRVDVGALVHDVARLGEGLKRGPGVTMRVDVQPGLPAAFVDPLRLTQVVTNLVSNALKFTEAGAVVLSLTGTSDGGLQLVVSDSGIGIPPERLEAIWKPFEQAEAGTTRRFGGTGLGLPIVRSLATLMGLSVDVTSRVGTGSVFTVRIPPQWVLPEPERASTATSLANRGSPILKTS